MSDADLPSSFHSHDIDTNQRARLGNPYQPAVSSEFFRNSNINRRFDARTRW